MSTILPTCLALRHVTEGGDGIRQWEIPPRKRREAPVSEPRQHVLQQGGHEFGIALRDLQQVEGRVFHTGTHRRDTLGVPHFPLTEFDEAAARSQNREALGDGLSRQTS